MGKKIKHSNEFRFSRLYKTDSNTSCWLWMGCCKASQRGKLLPLFSVFDGEKYFLVSARRFAFSLVGNDLSNNLEIYNVCGNDLCVNPDHSKETTLENRFWMHVNKQDADSCWMWMGSHTKEGYGNFNSSKAHRISYQLHFGEFPPYMDVLHKCDNPSCVNPDHLFLGTAQDNSDDMKRKGRASRGEASGNSKLTAQDVIDIRQGISDKKSCVDLGRRFGVTSTAISDIKRGRTWKWLKTGQKEY